MRLSSLSALLSARSSSLSFSRTISVYSYAFFMSLMTLFITQKGTAASPVPIWVMNSVMTDMKKAEEQKETVRLKEREEDRAERRAERLEDRTSRHWAPD